MSYFHGKQGPGAKRSRKEILRAEAELRNLATPHERRRVHRVAVERLGHCPDCQEG